jgi:hypothetical protein
MTTAVGSEYRSELFQRIAAEGEARAVLTVLEARGVAVPAEVRERILACTDLAQLDRWLHRASTATTVDDVLH